MSTNLARILAIEVPIYPKCHPIWRESSRRVKGKGSGDDGLKESQTNFVCSGDSNRWWRYGYWSMQRRIWHRFSLNWKLQSREKLLSFHISLAVCWLCTDGAPLTKNLDGSRCCITKLAFASFGGLLIVHSLLYGLCQILHCELSTVNELMYTLDACFLHVSTSTRCRMSAKPRKVYQYPERSTYALHSNETSRDLADEALPSRLDHRKWHIHSTGMHLLCR